MEVWKYYKLNYVIRNRASLAEIGDEAVFFLMACWGSIDFSLCQPLFLANGGLLHITLDMPTLMSGSSLYIL